jgi:hypothetical protein
LEELKLTDAEIAATEAEKARIEVSFPLSLHLGDYEADIMGLYDVARGARQESSSVHGSSECDGSISRGSPVDSGTSRNSRRILRSYEDLLGSESPRDERSW